MHTCARTHHTPSQRCCRAHARFFDARFLPFSSFFSFSLSLPPPSLARARCAFSHERMHSCPRPRRHIHPRTQIPNHPHQHERAATHTRTGRSHVDFLQAQVPLEPSQRYNRVARQVYCLQVPALPHTDPTYPSDVSYGPQNTLKAHAHARLLRASWSGRVRTLSGLYALMSLASLGQTRSLLPASACVRARGARLYLPRPGARGRGAPELSNARIARVVRSCP